MQCFHFVKCVAMTHLNGPEIQHLVWLHKKYKGEHHNFWCCFSKNSFWGEKEVLFTMNFTPRPHFHVESKNNIRFVIPAFLEWSGFHI